MKKLHRLNANGIARFQNFLDSQDSTEPESFDMELLTSPEFAMPLASDYSIEETCDFSTRYEAAATLMEIANKSGLADVALDRGYWCWLSWLWFESLCPVGKDGRRKPGESARWILNLDWNRYYRHLLAGPWWIRQSHVDDPERARALLCTPVAKPGELVAQVASRQGLVSNPGFVAMLTLLFYDSSIQKLRKGVSGKGGGGNARRLATVIDQLDMIWDLYSAGSGDFIKLLPREFDRYKSAAPRSTEVDPARKT